MKNICDESLVKIWCVNDNWGRWVIDVWIKEKKKGFLIVVKSIRDLWLKWYYSIFSFEIVRELFKNLLDVV